jgi:hypothetical protein
VLALVFRQDIVLTAARVGARLLLARPASLRVDPVTALRQF